MRRRSPSSRRAVPPAMPASPTDATIKVAPKGVHLETLEELKRYAAQIEVQAVQNKAMPLANRTGMTGRGTRQARHMDRQAMMSIADVNAMSPQAFIEAFGDVAEHSPWVAREARCVAPLRQPRGAWCCTSRRAIRAANRDAQLALIRAHPDLATKAKLTEDSTREQAGAGLNTLTRGGVRPLHRSQHALQAALRLSLHLRRQGRHQAHDPRQLRGAGGQ